MLPCRFSTQPCGPIWHGCIHKYKPSDLPSTCQLIKRSNAFYFYMIIYLMHNARGRRASRGAMGCRPETDDADRRCSALSPIPAYRRGRQAYMGRAPMMDSTKVPMSPCYRYVGSIVSLSICGT